MAVNTVKAKADWKSGTLVECAALLCALGGCMSIVASSFAPKFNVDLKGFSVELEGDIDPDGFTGKNPNVRKGFSEIRYKMHIVSDSPKENIDRLYKFIETHCPVKDTLAGVPVVGTYEVKA